MCQLSLVDWGCHGGSCVVVHVVDFHYDSMPLPSLLSLVVVTGLSLWQLAIIFSSFSDDDFIHVIKDDK